MGKKIVVITLAAGFLVACTADSSDSDPTSGSAPQQPTDTRIEPAEHVQRVPCGDNIGVRTPPTDQDYAMVDDAVALPSTNRPALQAAPVHDSGAPGQADALPAGEWFWAKQGLVVSGGPRIHLWVAPEASDEIRIAWGHAPITPSTSVVVACPPTTEWLAFPGGYWVQEPGCYTIHIQVNSDPARRVDVGVGAPCPGQPPPVEP